MPVHHVSATPRSTPGLISRRNLPRVMMVVAVVLVLWVVLGRMLVGALGPWAVIYAGALGVPLLLLHTVAALLFMRDARNQPSSPAPLRTMLTVVGSWVVMFCFGFSIPDLTPRGPESVLTALAGPQTRGVTYGFTNIFGVLSVAMGVALVLLAVTELRTTRRAQRGESLTEDDLLDRLETQHQGDIPTGPQAIPRPHEPHVDAPCDPRRFTPPPGERD